MRLTEEDLFDERVVRKEILALYFTTFEEEVDHCDDDGWRLVLMALVVGHPLDYDQKVHVAKYDK